LRENSGGRAVSNAAPNQLLAAFSGRGAAGSISAGHSRDAAIPRNRYSQNSANGQPAGELRLDCSGGAPKRNKRVKRDKQTRQNKTKNSATLVFSGRARVCGCAPRFAHTTRTGRCFIDMFIDSLAIFLIKTHTHIPTLSLSHINTHTHTLMTVTRGKKLKLSAFTFYSLLIPTSLCVLRAPWNAGGARQACLCFGTDVCMSLSLNNSLSEQGLARPFIVFFPRRWTFCIKKSLLVSVFLRRSIFLPKFERGSDILN
jgi:hypothetical protein